MSRARPPVEIRDFDELTQFVTKELARERPLEGEDEMSMLLGKLTPLQAVTCIAKRGVIPKEDGVRHTTAGQLREAGFQVESTPEKANPLHVSVKYGREWDENASEAFRKCLSQPTWEEASD